MQFTSDRKMIYYISLMGFFAIFSTTISKNPVLPLFSQAIGANDTVIGLIAAFSPLAGILFSFPIGTLSDYLGRKWLLIVSGVVFLLAPILYLFITVPFWLIPLRFFHGTATAILGPVISAVIVERFPTTKGEMLGRYSSATLIGRTIAPLAGGIIISYFTFYPGLIPYKIVYIVAAIAAVPVFIMTLMYHEEQSKALDILGFSVFKDNFITFFANVQLRATALVDMATYFSFGTLETFLPIFLILKNISAYQIGLIFAIQILVIAGTKPFFGKIADRIDKRIQIVIGLLILGCSIAAIPFLSSFVWFLILSAVFGFGMSFSTVATSAYVGDIAKKEQIGASMGALSSTMDIGQSFGPLATGIIITAIGYASGFFMSFFVAITVAGVFAFSVRDRNSQ